MQHQTTYYRTVPVSEKPKHPDLYHTLVENESLGIEGLPCHNNYIGDPNGGYWEIDGESKVTHYLQPITREALSAVGDGWVRVDSGELPKANTRCWLGWENEKDVWDGYYDGYLFVDIDGFAIENTPTHYMIMPLPSPPINK